MINKIWINRLINQSIVYFKIQFLVFSNDIVFVVVVSEIMPGGGGAKTQSKNYNFGIHAT